MPVPALGSPSVAAELPPQLSHAVWHANQMGSYQAPVISTGHATLNSELPHGGWPGSALIELLLQQAGIGEMRLLRPALAAIARQHRVALVQPPHWPQAAAWIDWGMASEHLLWIRINRTADALWTAEQILRNGSCGALLFWQPHIRNESLRRLHLAAQSGNTVFWLMRPLCAAQIASPAPLRLGLLPANAGVEIQIVKRRGPQRDASFYLPLDDMPAALPISTSSRHACVDRFAPAPAVSGNVSSALV